MYAKYYGLKTCFDVDLNNLEIKENENKTIHLKPDRIFKNGLDIDDFDLEEKIDLSTTYLLGATGFPLINIDVTELASLKEFDDLFSYDLSYI